MKKAVTDELNAIGSKVIFIQKFENSAENEYPWWKFIKRPETSFKEMIQLQRKLPYVQEMAFLVSTTASIESSSNQATGVNYYGVSERFDKIQNISIGAGRYLQLSEFTHGSNVILIGYALAEQIYGTAENALNKKIKLKGNSIAQIVGVFSKQGRSIIDAWDYDHSIMLPYSFMKQLAREEYSNPVIMVKANDRMSESALKEELRGAMRSIRRIQPGTEDNFALNDIAFISKLMDPIFTGMNIGGWVIAALSLFVGMFGVANIMFVTVRERTSQIGLKKAIGAKRINIMTEFLIESIILCLIGGLIGLLSVFVLTQIFSLMLSFKVFIPGEIVFLAVCICVAIGVLAGIIPAMKAARINPVVAIRNL